MTVVDPTGGSVWNAVHEVDDPHPTPSKDEDVEEAGEGEGGGASTLIRTEAENSGKDWWKNLLADALSQVV